MAILRGKIAGGSEPRPTTVNCVILQSKIIGGSKPPPYDGESGDFAGQITGVSTSGV